MFSAMSKFPPTRWSLVAAAAGTGPDAGSAFEELYKQYLSPILSVVRGVVRATHVAQDLTQGFFARLFEERSDLARADPSRGRFHKWLTREAMNFMSKERRCACAKKRGGEAVALSFDTFDAEDRYTLELANLRTPDHSCARRRTLEVLEQVMDEVERSYADPQQRARVQRLKIFLDGREVPYKALAEELGEAAGTLRKQVHDMKARHQQFLHKYFRRRGVKPADIDSEIRTLFDALS